MMRFLKRKNLTVLSLHRISEENDYFFQPVRPRLFEKLLAYVSKNYEVINFGLLDAVKKKNKKPLLILSFDDGYYDFIEHALPLLHKYRLTCNHNLVNICLNDNSIIWTQKLNAIFNFYRDHSIERVDVLEKQGFTFRLCNSNWHNYYLKVFQYMLNQPFAEKQNMLDSMKQHFEVSFKYRMMSWEDAAYLKKNNVEIGSHTYHHDSLNSINDRTQLLFEISGSKRELEEKLHIGVNVLALPNALYTGYTSTVIECCKDAGFNYVLSSNDTLIRFSELNEKFNLTDRVMLRDESTNEMISRVELFHSAVKRFI